MSFKFAARTILELGKELISSDEVALYELIKNAIDAGSTRVGVSATITLPSSAYREAVARMREEGAEPQAVVDYLERRLINPDRAESKTFMSDLRPLSRQSEFLERLESQYNNLNYIEVRDTGQGMSLEDLSDVFLRIGTPSRHNENKAGVKKLGDKGIGRLSAMRLGDRLEVKTCRRDDLYWNLLDIDWTLFSHDRDVDADAVHIEPEIGDEKTRAETQGTIVRIRALQGDWDIGRFTDIMQGSIARMVDPFDFGSANRRILARHNGTRIQVPSIPRELLRAAHATCHVDFRMDGDTPVLKGVIDYRYRERQSRIDARGAEVYSLAQESVRRRAKRGHAAFKLMPVRPSAFKLLGAFSCDLYWYNRRVVTAVEGLTTKVPDTRREISNWSGGPMLYRHGFRILPYGDPKDDWLALDETAFGVKGFKLNRQQVIGRVCLNSSHDALREQTSREGLVTADTFNALRKVLLWVVHTEFRALINEADDLERLTQRAAEYDTAGISSAQRRVERDLAALRERVGDGASAEMGRLAQSVGTLSERSQRLLDRLSSVIEESTEEREKFVYLAGIGLMTEFIFHELERAVSYTLEVISRGAVKRISIESLAEQLNTLHKRIASFDEMTTEKRQTKVRFDVIELVQRVLDSHIGEMERHGIELDYDRPRLPLRIRAVRGMVIQIVENLVVNATYWLKQQKQFEPDFRPFLKVCANAETKRLSFEDNGPGVALERCERIFQPFVTTKPTGDGRGLGLYIAREMAQYHRWHLMMDAEADRVREGRINTFVLDMESDERA